jgi:hypothetical protein
MQRISSRMTRFYKRVLPIVMLGFLLLFITPPLVSGKFPPFPLILFPVLMIAVGYFVMARLIWDMVDEVWDAGDGLIVRNKRQEDRIPLASVMNVNYSPFINPPRVTLKLRTPSVFGDVVTFCAPVRFMPFSENPMVDELIRRIDAARMRAR